MGARARGQTYCGFTSGDSGSDTKRKTGCWHWTGKIDMCVRATDITPVNIKKPFRKERHCSGDNNMTQKVAENSSITKSIKIERKQLYLR